MGRAIWGTIKNRQQQKNWPNACQICEQVNVAGQKGKYEVACRRWIVREIHACRMTIGELIHRFQMDKKKGADLIYFWIKRYGIETIHTSPLMNEKEKQKLEALEKQNKTLLKQLKEAR